MQRKTYYIRLLLLSLWCCPIGIQSQSTNMVDPLATKQTKALYNNLIQIKEQGILYGHQDDVAYGVKWTAEPGRSDVKEVAGSYPAVYGWDISKIGKYPFNIDSVDFKMMQQWIMGKPTNGVGSIPLAGI